MDSGDLWVLYVSSVAAVCVYTVLKVGLDV